MYNENIIILKMLDQGKISVDDTVKLLNTINSIDLKTNSIEHNLNKFSNVLDSLTKDIKLRVKKDVPKIKENTHSILSKTGELFSDFGKNVKDIFTSENAEIEIINYSEENNKN